MTFFEFVLVDLTTKKVSTATHSLQDKNELVDLFESLDPKKAHITEVVANFAENAERKTVVAYFEGVQSKVPMVPEELASARVQHILATLKTKLTHEVQNNASLRKQISKVPWFKLLIGIKVLTKVGKIKRVVQRKLKEPKKQPVGQNVNPRILPRENTGLLLAQFNRDYSSFVKEGDKSLYTAETLIANYRYLLKLDSTLSGEISGKLSILRSEVTRLLNSSLSEIQEHLLKLNDVENESDDKIWPVVRTCVRFHGYTPQSCSEVNLNVDLRQQISEKNQVLAKKCCAINQGFYDKWLKSVSQDETDGSHGSLNGLRECDQFLSIAKDYMIPKFKRLFCVRFWPYDLKRKDYNIWKEKHNAFQKVFTDEVNYLFAYINRYCDAFKESPLKLPWRFPQVRATDTSCDEEAEIFAGLLNG